MPSTLTKFLAWLIDDKSFEKANEPHVMSKEKLRKVLGLVESIVSIARCTFTPFHLGLAIELYHEYGSRTLIETLFSHGFCASYTEVRRYLTSIAVHEVENMENGAFAPDGIISVQEDGGLIQEGADNIDLNTETIDDKDTFHSMAHAVFQTCRSHDDSCLRQLKVRRGQERTFQLTESASTIMSCPDLFSNHKEADTRMLLHAIHADARFGDMNVKGRIIIKSPDTDVLLLCIHFFPSMRNTKELWFKTGTVTRTKDGRRYLPVHDICHIHGPLVCKLLPAVHALTGCETTSSFFRIGKKTVLKTLQNNIDEFADLNNLCLFDSETSIDVSRNFVTRLYDQKGKMKSARDNLNKLRVKIAKQKDVSLAKLPPCEASFVQDVLRASLQTYICMKSETAQPPEKSALDFGWEDQNGLSPVYFVGQTSSDFLKDLLCTCKGKSSCSQGCVCVE